MVKKNGQFIMVCVWGKEPCFRPVFRGCCPQKMCREAACVLPTSREIQVKIAQLILSPLLTEKFMAKLHTKFLTLSQT